MTVAIFKLFVSVFHPEYIYLYYKMVLGNRQLEETLSVLREITGVFQSDDDVKLIKSCLKLANEVVTSGERESAKTRELIQGTFHVKINPSLTVWYDRVIRKSIKS